MTLKKVTKKFKLISNKKKPFDPHGLYKAISAL